MSRQGNRERTSGYPSNREYGTQSSTTGRFILEKHGKRRNKPGSLIWWNMISWLKGLFLSTTHLAPDKTDQTQQLFLSHRLGRAERKECPVGRDSSGSGSETEIIIVWRLQLVSETLYILSDHCDLVYFGNSVHGSFLPIKSSNFNTEAV